MKQRITYLLPQGSGLSASDLQVTSDSLRFAKAGQAAQEWRFTLGLDELPDELRDILNDTHELHIRWSSTQNAELIPPLVSRLPAGFHAFFTPSLASKGPSDIPLCDLFDRFLGSSEGKCVSVDESFSKPQLVSSRFASAATYQYFRNAPVGSEMVRWILKTVDSAGKLDALERANYVDVDFDAISHALTLTAVLSPENDAVPRGDNVFRKPQSDDRLEVGTLQVEPSDEPEELSLGGFLTVIGEDDKPSPTMFSFPSRHHPLRAGTRSTFKVSSQQPTGLHPKLDITFPHQNLKPPKDSCALHAYWTLPSSIFIDRYQFSDPLFLTSQNLVALRSLSGEDDLEAPEWVLNRWGSAALFEVAHPKSPQSEGPDWTVTIPAHLRYLSSPQRTTDSSDQATVEVPWPSIFWACEAEEGLKMSNNPFDRVNLGYDGLFGPKTMLYHFPPAASGADSLAAEIKMPVLNPQNSELVRLGTALAVVLGFAWIVGKLFKSDRTVAEKKVQ